LSLPRPEPGLVIAYDYLWRHEHEAGRDYGCKIRPCAIVVAVENNSGATEVVMAPIMHLEPMPPSQDIEIPSKVKQHLGLDHDRSWVILNDLNVFTWLRSASSPKRRGRSLPLWVFAAEIASGDRHADHRARQLGARDQSK
jgi:hypothetical protein